MRFGIRYLGLLGLAMASLPTGAMAAQCGLQTLSGGVANVQYDPFAGTSTNVVLTNLVLGRVNGPNGEKTMELDFYVKPQSSSADGMQMIVASATGNGTAYGIGNDIFHNYAGPFPTPSTVGQSAVPGTFFWDFGGNAANRDNFTLGLNITLPPNLNLPANQSTQPLVFDIVYACEGTGPGGNFTDTGTFTGALQINITVKSALQASYAGQPLNFGDISDPNNNTPPSSFRTSSSDYIRVQSSGPYTVELTSANAYRLKHPAGSLANATERVKYGLNFLGEYRNNTDSTAITKTCGFAGVGMANEDHLYLRGTLEETGYGKTPASTNYSDLLTVTITPQAAGFSPINVANCSNFTVP